MTTYNYDSQIARLSKNPSLITTNWLAAEGLFKCIGGPNSDGGCLTMIRCGEGEQMKQGRIALINGVCDKDITMQIRNDERIPKEMRDIQPEHLPVFKEWQERIDKLQNS